MDPTRFDRWTRRLHSRRAVGRTLVGVGLGLGATRPAVTDGHAGPVAPTPATPRRPPRFGCTRQDNSCPLPYGNLIPCPKAPIAGLCVLSNRGRPLCVATGGACFACTRHADCAPTFGPRARCIRDCPFCQNNGTRSLCVTPLGRS